MFSSLTSCCPPQKSHDDVVTFVVVAFSNSKLYNIYLSLTNHCYSQLLQLWRNLDHSKIYTVDVYKCLYMCLLDNVKLSRVAQSSEFRILHKLHKLHMICSFFPCTITNSGWDLNLSCPSHKELLTQRLNTWPEIRTWQTWFRLG